MDQRESTSGNIFRPKQEENIHKGSLSRFGLYCGSSKGKPRKTPSSLMSRAKYSSSISLRSIRTSVNF